MRPPICAICGKDFRANIQGGELVHFALSEEDKELNKRFSQPGFTGHPQGMEWFCNRHLKIAKKYTHLAYTEAKEKIKNDSLSFLNRVIKLILK